MCGSFILQTNATQLQSITLIYNFGVGHWTKLTPICNCSPQDHKYLRFAIVPSVSPSRIVETVFRELPPPILFFLATAKCRYKSIVKGRNFAQTQDNWWRGNTFIDQSIKMRKVLGIIHWVDGLFLWPVEEHLNTSIFEVDFILGWIIEHFHPRREPFRVHLWGNVWIISSVHGPLLRLKLLFVLKSI